MQQTVQASTRHSKYSNAGVSPCLDSNPVVQMDSADRLQKGVASNLSCHTDVHVEIPSHLEETHLYLKEKEVVILIPIN